MDSSFPISLERPSFIQFNTFKLCTGHICASDKRPLKSAFVRFAATRIVSIRVASLRSAEERFAPLTDKFLDYINTCKY